MKSNYLTLFALLSILLFSCGPDSELVASGVHHSCALKEITAKVKSDPTNPELLEQLKEKANLLQAVIETADEGSREALRKAIQDGSKDCK